VSSFETTTDIVRDTATVRVKGYLSGLSGERLESEVARLIGEGSRSIVINFRETDMVNSVGVSILVGIIEKVRDAGGALSFSDLTPVNEEVFRLMGLHRHVRIRPRQEAVADKENGGGEGQGKAEANR
jgi:anti-anti-sigma factor